MRLAAFAAALCAAALVTGSGSNGSAGFEHPRVLKGTIEQPDQKRLELEKGIFVDFVSADSGFLGTGGDRLLWTSDGGRTWDSGRARPRFTADMDFVTPRVGFALTTGNALLVTLDGARSWQRARRFPAGGFNRPHGGLDFIDADRGWVLPSHGPLYRTTDGGRNWVSLDVPCKEFEDPVGPTFFDSQHGYLVCAGQPGAGSQSKSLFATADGGMTWQVKVGQPGTWGGYASKIEFRTDDSGLLVSDRGGLDATNDGGRSVRMLLPTDDEDSISDVSWPTRERLYVVTFRAGVLRSDDGGHHWRRVFPAGDAPPNGPLTFSAKSEGIGFGAETISGGPKTELATNDGGQTWVRVHLDPPLPLADQVFRFGNTIIVANGASLAISDDAGRHWRRAAAHGWFSFVSPTVGFRTEGRSVYKTEDGGSTWTFVGRGQSDLYGVVFMSATDAFVVEFEAPQDDGKKPTTPAVNRLLVSYDGGERWKAVDAPLMGTVFAMHRLDDDHWWLFANVSCPRVAKICGGQIWRTADGGKHWDLVELPRELYTSSISFVSPDVGYAGSAADGLYRTTDGGVSWSYVYPGRTETVIRGLAP